MLQETALLSLQQKFEQLQKEYLNLLHGTECEELLLGKGAFGGRIFRKRIFNQKFLVEKVESKSFDPLKAQIIQCQNQNYWIRDDDLRKAGGKIEDYVPNNNVDIQFYLGHYKRQGCAAQV